MIVVGLTGSIGMGKSTIADMFARLGVRVCSADAIVHQLMGKGGKAVAEIGRQFPGVVKDGAVNRKALGEVVFKDKKKLKQLEELLHPLVVDEENRFIAREKRKGARLVLLDIPLLFETGAETRCDMTVTVTAPEFLQKQRVMKRPNMTEDKLASILKSQMDDSEKRHRADMVIQTGLGRHHSFKEVAELVKVLRECAL